MAVTPHRGKADSEPAATGAPGPQSTTQSRVAALTGLRGLAAASVVFYHVWFYGAPGAVAFPVGPLEKPFAKLDLGVTFFFVLSGFLLYRSFARALLTTADWPRMRNFAIARFLRIVPVYWAIVLTVTVLAERQLFEQPWRLAANLLFVEFWFPSFLPENLGSANGSVAIVPSWSLVVELGFYLTLPLLCLPAAWFARRTGRRATAAWLPVVALAIVGLAAVGVEHAVDGDLRRAWVLNFPMHAGAFAAGMAGTTIWLLVEHGKLRLPRHWRAMAVLTAIIVAVPPLKLVNTGHLTLVDSRLPVAVSFALLLLLVVLATDASRLRSLLGSRVLVLAGLASYSMFLVHDPIIRAVRAEDVASATLPGFLLTLGVVGTATAAATFVSYRLLERPSFELKRRLVAAPTAEPVQRVLARLAGRVGEPHGVRFTVEAAAELRPVEASTLEPLVAPLLENAVVYGDAPFVVRAEEAGEALRVVVEDAGRGIDPSFVPRLFEPHARSEASSSVPGDGLGLATARRLARQHGGDVTFESPLEGGARFAVMIPRQEPPTAASRLKARLTRILPKRSEFEPQPTATRLVRA